MDDVVFFWNGWKPLLRVIVVGSLTYVSIIAILRVSGKRTLASMNAFDFVVTVALGSAFGRILTAKQVSLAEAITTFVLLAVLQMVLSRLESKNWFYKLITAQPTLLYYRGRFMKKAMQEQRVRTEALLSAVRQNKLSSLEEVEAIVLETDGSVSVIQRSDRSDQSSYQPLINRQLPQE